MSLVLHTALDLQSAPVCKRYSYVFGTAYSFRPAASSTSQKVPVCKRYSYGPSVLHAALDLQSTVLYCQSLSAIELQRTVAYSLQLSE